MIENRYFTDLKQAIAGGSYIANREQVLLLEYLERTILSRDDIYFDYGMMENYIRFSEKYFFPLALYQKFVSSFIFLYWKKNGRVVFREFFITLGRGGGKNGWMSTLGAFFISQLHGIDGYNATITANSEDQAKMSFTEVYNTIQKKKLERHYEAKKTEITGKKTNSVFKYRTNNPKTMDSARDGCLFFDEVHQFEDDSAVKVQRSGLGKVRNARTFYFGTNGYVRDGFYDKQIERSMKILEGKTDRIGYFPFICKLEDIKEMDKPELWAKANPMFNENSGYADQVYSEVMEDYLDLEESPSGRQEFVIKRMNFTEGDGERDVAPYKQIQAAANMEIPELEGRSCAAGFDYASIRDFASVGLLFKLDGKFVWIQHSFVRKGYLNEFKPKAPIQKWEEQGYLTIVDEPSIDPRHMVNWLVEQREKFQIEIVAADGFRMDLLKPLLEEEGFEYEFIRNPAGVQAKIAPIIEDGFANERINYCQDEMMKWYTNNTYVKEDARGNKTFLKKEPVRRKTDGFHAFIAALYKRDTINEYAIDDVLDFMDDINF